MNAICSAAAVFAVMIYLAKEPPREQFAWQWSAVELRRSTASEDFFRKVTYLAAWPEFRQVMKGGDQHRRPRLHS